MTWFDGTTVPAGPATVIYCAGTSQTAPTTESGDAAVPGMLGGVFADSDSYTPATLLYPASAGPFLGSDTMGASVAAGATTLVAQVKSLAASGQVIVVGFSQGSMVMDAALALLQTDPDAPDPSKVAWIETGNPCRPGGMIFNNFSPGQTVPVFDVAVLDPPSSQYNVMVVCQQYEGASDWPDLGLLDAIEDVAVINAWIGFTQMHVGVPAGLMGKLLSALASAANGDTSALSSITIAPTGYARMPQQSELIASETTSLGGTVHTYMLQPTWPLPVTLSLPSAVQDIASLIVNPAVEAGYDRGGRPWSTFATPGS